MIKLISILFILAFLSSCGGGSSNTKSVSSNIEDDNPISKTSFSSVLTIIENNCNNCHGYPLANAAPMSLVNHQQISFFADSIINRINLDLSDKNLMPQNGPKLSSQDIQIIEDWVKEGSLNN